MMFNGEKYKELDLNFKDDRKARNVLGKLIKESDFSILRKAIKGNIAFIFGCGPSLEYDIRQLKKYKLITKGVAIAADGAAKALLEERITPKICVTDLDGDLKSLKKASEKGCIMVIHAHGDNITVLKSVVPKLSGKKLGTTQVNPTKKIKNYGGFTDGDRAVHIAVKFKAKSIILFGMDFGQKIGGYSGKKKTKTKMKKLAIGKKLIEKLAKKTRIPIINATKKGAGIKNTRRASIKDLILEK